jgi:hypothetical protein
MSGVGRILSKGAGLASTAGAATLPGMRDVQAPTVRGGTGSASATSDDNLGTSRNTVTALIASGGERHCPNPELHWIVHVADAY